MIVIAALEVWLRAIGAIFTYAGWDTDSLAARCDPRLDAAGLNDRARPWRQSS